MYAMTHFYKEKSHQNRARPAEIELIVFPVNRCDHVFYYGNQEITSVNLEKFVLFVVLHGGDF